MVLSIGINQTKKTNDIMVMIKLAIIVLFIVCTVWYINPANWKPFSPYGIYTFQPGSTQPYGIVPAASIVFFSFTASTPSPPPPRRPSIRTRRCRAAS